MQTVQMVSKAGLPTHGCAIRLWPGKAVRQARRKSRDLSTTCPRLVHDLFHDLLSILLEKQRENKRNEAKLLGRVKMNLKLFYAR